MSEFDVDAGGIPTDPPKVAGGNAGADPYVADELAGHDDGDERTVLELLESELADAVPEVPVIRLALKRNPDYVVTYRTNLDGDEIERARAMSRDRKKVDGVDGPKFAALICVTACLEIHRRGSRLLDDADRPMRFNHRSFMRAMAAGNSATKCAQAFYRDDALMDAVARKVMAESGWGEDVADVTAVDPPDESSSS